MKNFLLMSTEQSRADINALLCSAKTRSISNPGKWAAYSQGVLYVSAILCLFILDVPVMSDEVLDFERKKDYVNVRKFIGGVFD